MHTKYNRIWHCKTKLCGLVGATLMHGLPLILTMCFATEVVAQSAASGSGSPPSASSAESGDLQEIIVTAQKRAEDLQKIPAAISAETGNVLVEQGVTDVRGLGQLFPAIELGQDYIYTQIDIRGVGANNDAPALDPAIAFNIDGVYQSRDYGTVRSTTSTESRYCAARKAPFTAATQPEAASTS